MTQPEELYQLVPPALNAKFCYQCKTSKPIDQFWICRVKPDGHQGACIECKKKWSAARSKLEVNKRYHRNYSLKRFYGISLAVYEGMFEKQEGKCAACSGGPDPKYGYFHLDYDHKTGKVRGLLCFGCNVALGNVRDSAEVLRKLTIYLELHQQCAGPGEEILNETFTKIHPHYRDKKQSYLPQKHKHEAPVDPQTSLW